MIKKLLARHRALPFVLVVAIAAIPVPGHAQEKSSKATPPPYAANAVLKTQDGKEVGTVVFRQTESGFLWIQASFHSLPTGTHGFHIHETGKCEGDFKSAGGHYAPGGNDHGVLAKNGPHAGDLPNIKVSAEGETRVEYFTDRLTLEKGSKNTVLDEDGSAVMLHSGVDDYESQPSGDAGSRLACGVIQGAIEESHKH